MKLTELNIDCLENVLAYLELRDLLSAASSSKQLNQAANFVFIRKYSKKEMNFENIHLKHYAPYKFEQYSIVFSDFKASLQLLRCFGHLVENIVFFSFKTC